MKQTATHCLETSIDAYVTIRIMPENLIPPSFAFANNVGSGQMCELNYYYSDAMS